jgi:hypothetical protein
MLQGLERIIGERIVESVEVIRNVNAPQRREIFDEKKVSERERGERKIAKPGPVERCRLLLLTDLLLSITSIFMTSIFLSFSYFSY